MERCLPCFPQLKELPLPPSHSFQRLPITDSNISHRHFKLPMPLTKFLLFSTPSNYSSWPKLFLLQTSAYIPNLGAKFDFFLSRILHIPVSKPYWFYCLNTIFRIFSTPLSTHAWNDSPTSKHYIYHCQSQSAIFPQNHSYHPLLLFGHSVMSDSL